jgi:hypothetical protein
MTEYYDDPYSFNYAIQNKGQKNCSNPVIKNPPLKNLNVFNPNIYVQPKETEENQFNEENPQKNKILNKSQVNNNIEELKGNIDFDKNVYEEKTIQKEYKNQDIDFDEELPLLEGKIKLRENKNNIFFHINLIEI